MNTSSLDPDVQQRIAIVLPIIAVIVSIFLCYPAYGNYRASLKALDAKRQEFARLRAEPLPPAGSGITAAADLPSEPPLFKQQVNAIVLSAGCRMVGFEVVPIDSSAQAAPAQSANAVPIRPKRAKVSVGGTYPALRRFLARLNAADRVYAVTAIDVTNKNRDNRSPIRGMVADIVIERYVVPVATASGR